MQVVGYESSAFLNPPAVSTLEAYGEGKFCQISRPIIIAGQLDDVSILPVVCEYLHDTVDGIISIVIRVDIMSLYLAIGRCLRKVKSFSANVYCVLDVICY